MGPCYGYSRFMLFCNSKLQKILSGYIKKVWIPTKAMAISSDYEYCIWQNRRYG